MTDFVVSNITDKIDLKIFKDFVYDLPNIRKLSADLSNNQEVIEITKNFYNANNCCNYIAFSDEKDVKHLPWHQFDSVFALEKKSFCCINQPAGMFTSPHYDNFEGYCKSNDVDLSLSHKIERHIVFLDDWQWGQTFCFPNSMFLKWKQGDTITWPYKTWHSTANAGLKNRIVITVTGIPKIVNNGDNQ